MYLNAYMPNFQVSRQVVSFMYDLLGAKVPSPALFNKIGLGFPSGGAGFATEHGIPLGPFRDP
jgi:hypothetical protein